MGEIYTSDYISITREEDILIQEWTKIPLNTQIFQQELLNFLEVFKSERPESLLWLQENGRIRHHNRTVPSANTGATQVAILLLSEGRSQYKRRCLGESSCVNLILSSWSRVRPTG